MSNVSSFETLGSSHRAVFPLTAARTPALIHVERTQSTNDLVRHLIADPTVTTPHLTTVVADHQMAGRGRLGRTWTSLDGRSLTASIVIQLPNTPEFTASSAWVLFCGALSARDAITSRLDSLGHRTDLKWPNDVLVDQSRKVAGILGEYVGETADSQHIQLILGIGINISMEPAERPTPIATALSLEGDTQAASSPAATADALLAAILDALAPRLDALITHHGDAHAAGLLAELTERTITLGQRVAISTPTDAACAPSATGTATAINPDGSLQVALDPTDPTSDPTEITVTTGDVTLIGDPNRLDPPTE